MWKLDRLGRSVKEVLIIAFSPHERDIALKILTSRLSGTYSTRREVKFFFEHFADVVDNDGERLTPTRCYGKGLAPPLSS